MEPLRITMRFDRPVAVTDYAIHLDSILAWAQADRAMENNDSDPWNTDHLPLGLHRGVWQASMFVFEPKAEKQVMPMVKRHNLHDLAIDRDRLFITRKNHISVKSGLYRAHNMRFVQQWMRRADAWCLGNKQEIKELLSRVSCLGKYTRNGLGRLLSMSILSDEKALRLWRVRHLPAGEFKKESGYALAMRTATPPYWDKAKLAPCFVPVDPWKLISANPS